MSAPRRLDPIAQIARTAGTRVLLLTALAAVAACADQQAPSAPSATKGSTGNGSSATPSLVYVSDASGTPQLWTYVNGRTSRLSFSDAEDDQPSSAAGRIAFSSTRDGNSEIYLGTTTLAALKRLTIDPAEDMEPALSPDGARLVFVSTRSGTPRLWMTDSTGANQTPLETGSESFTPERAPAWSPSGTLIAFSSTRSGTSQIYVVGLAGGEAQQLTHELGGAFDPAWSADGATLYFVSASSTPKVRALDLETGQASDFASGAASLGEPTCAVSGCFLVRGAYSPSGDIVAPGKRGQLTTVIATSADERSPAILVP